MNALVWGGWLALFCVLEGLAAFKQHLPFRVPWDTFSRAFWDAQSVRYLGTVVTLGGLFVLSVLTQHLLQRRNLEEGDRK